MALGFWGPLTKPHIYHWQSFTWRNLQFSNPLGTAGGLDKNARLIHAFWALGAGFVEVGTVTPKPQGPNSGALFDRDASSESLWNRLGFPNDGAAAVLARVKKLKRPYPTPLFLNIGKNRDTKLGDAHKDYVELVHTFGGYVDAFVVNISSPNTQGLRELLKPENLKTFLQPIVIANATIKTPLLLKLSPDLADEELKLCLDISAELGFSGWILTNTTLARPGNLARRYPADGGVSGGPLTTRSSQLLQMAVEHLGERRKDKLIISAGGVMSAEDVFTRLRLGAQLVQIYTTLVFNGPKFFREVNDRARSQ
jgi:dihydroorotate dehydrogenase